MFEEPDAGFSSNGCIDDREREALTGERTESGSPPPGV